MSSCICSMAPTRLMIVVLLDCVPGKLFKPWLPKIVALLDCVPGKLLKPSLPKIVALLDCARGKLLKPSSPKSSQASYLPESHAINVRYLAIARCWTSIVGLAVWEVTCWRADFNASDIVYVTDVLTTSVLLQCNTLSAMRLGHDSAPRCCMNTSSIVGVIVLCRFCFWAIGGTAQS